MAARPDSALTLRSRLFRARVGSALADRGAALALGAVLIVTAGAYVLGVRGVISAAAWQAGLGAGLAFVLLRALLGLFNRHPDPNDLREILAAHFGEEIRADPDVTRLSRQAIEQRLQLATARSEAPPALARAVDALLPALDRRLDRIATEARAAATGRGAARFQAGMSQIASKRLSEVSRIAETSPADRAATARKAADGLSAQVAASDGLVAHEADRLMALDEAVADFGTSVARALLALSKQDHAALLSLAKDMTGAEDGDPGRT
ncbi:MAG: hypothetical protein NTW20_05420 [Rhodobacterales bacterium]|nr:hypothetical protein [Rhodobacterales bacterium]